MNTILDQAPAAGDDIVEGEPVNITVARAAHTAAVPPVHGLSLAAAAAKLKTARFAHDPQPSAAGDDWVVIRQDPAPGTAHEVGKPVTLAVENRAATAGTAALAAGVGGAAGLAGAAGIAATTGAAGTAGTTGARECRGHHRRPHVRRGRALRIRGRRADHPRRRRIRGRRHLVRRRHPDAVPHRAGVHGHRQAPREPRLRRRHQRPALPPDGRRQAAARLTSAKHFLETPTRIDDGFAAVQVADDSRRLVTVSDDGKTVTPIAEGTFHHPAYSPSAACWPPSPTTGCASSTRGIRRRRRARPPRQRWAGPRGRRTGARVLVVNGASDALLSYTARGGDASNWKTPKPVYRAADIRSAVWIDDDRVAVLVAERRGGAAHLRLLTRGTNGRLKATKDFPALTGHELAAAGRHVALRRGDDAADDGPMLLLDTRRASRACGRCPAASTPPGASVASHEFARA